MSQFIKSINTSISTFIKEEEGSQVVEYALIIAVVSIGLIAALGTATNGTLRTAFTNLVTRINTCFTGTCV